jgi:hypothetical protein
LGTRPAFFERNFSHYLPLLFIAVAFGIRSLALRLRTDHLRAVGAAVLLVSSIVPAATILHTIRFDVLPGNYEKMVAAFRRTVQRENAGREYLMWLNLAYGDPYPEMKTYLDGHRSPYVVEFLDNDDRYTQRTLSQFAGDYACTKLAELHSPFRGISPSTLQQYLAVSHVVFRVDGPKERRAEASPR